MQKVIYSAFAKSESSSYIKLFHQKKSYLIDKKRFLISVQKSGTHLLAKILDQLNICWSYERGLMHFTVRYDLLEQGKRLDEILSNKRKYYILYRDPRDLIISQIFYQMTPPQAKKIINGHQFCNFTMAQLITKSLNSEHVKDEMIGGYANRLFKSLKFVNKLKKQTKKNILFIRFEDLIPAYAGGATEESRLETFKKICAFAGKKNSDEQIKRVMGSCWGNTQTFRSNEVKKVGQWERYFNADHIKLFQKKYNYLLLGLGYEADPNWHLKYLDKLNECHEQ